MKTSIDKRFMKGMPFLSLRGFSSMIVVGTSANGAVLHTVVGAALRGFKVVLPVDGMPDTTLYSEQYTAWHAVNSHGSRANTTLTRMEMIEF